MTIFFITKWCLLPASGFVLPVRKKLSADNDTQPREQGAEFQTLRENSNMTPKITLARHRASNIARRRTVPESEGFLPDQSEAGRYSQRQTGTSVWVEGTAKEVSLNDLLQGPIIIQILPARILEPNSSKTPPQKEVRDRDSGGPRIKTFLQAISVCLRHQPNKSCSQTVLYSLFWQIAGVGLFAVNTRKFPQPQIRSKSQQA